MTDYFMILRFPVPRDVFRRAGATEVHRNLIIKMALAIESQMGFPTNAAPTTYDEENNSYAQSPGTDFRIDTQYMQQNLARLVLQRNYNSDAHSLIVKTTKSLPITVTSTYKDGRVLTYPMLQRGYIPNLTDNPVKPTAVIVCAMVRPDNPTQYNHSAQDVGIFRGLPQLAGPDSKESHIHSTLTATAMLAIISALDKHTGV